MVKYINLKNIYNTASFYVLDTSSFKNEHLKHGIICISTRGCLVICSFFYAQWDSFQTEIQRVKSGGAAADDKKFIEVHNTAPVKVVVNVLLPTKEHPKVCIGKYLGYNTGNPVQLCVELIRKKLVNYHCYTLKHAVSYSMLRGYSFTFFRLISLNVYKKEHTFN